MEGCGKYTFKYQRIKAKSFSTSRNIHCVILEHHLKFSVHCFLHLPIISGELSFAHMSSENHSSCSK